jgi:hypothetical protein
MGNINFMFGGNFFIGLTVIEIIMNMDFMSIASNSHTQQSNMVTRTKLHLRVRKRGENGYFY